MWIIWLALASALLALAFAGVSTLSVLKMPLGTERMVEVYSAIKEGAIAYLNRQYRTLLIFMVVLSLVLAAAINWQTGVSFFTGALFSALAGYFGMRVAVEGNTRTANAAKEGIAKALSVAFRGGTVMGLSMVGLALLGLTVYYWLWRDPILFAGFGFGGSLVALFARIGGGIYTKSADVGADLVGKVEAGIPEDDPRNPAVIADAVGDNVGDVAGMAADIFETYAVTLVGAMLLGWPLFQTTGNAAFVEYPLLLGAIAILSTVVGTFFVRLRRGESPVSPLIRAIAATAVLAIVGFAYATYVLFGSYELFYSAMVGVVIVVLLALLTNYYTHYGHKPVQRIAEASQAGPAINLINGLANALESALLPVIVIALGVVLAYTFGSWCGGAYYGFYGVAVAAMAMLSVAGIIVSVDAFGPIIDNAGGIAEMADLEPEVREVTDTLDAVGNTTKALTKTFAIGSAGLAALSLLLAYLIEIEEYVGIALEDIGARLALVNPKVILGLLVGGAISFLFTAFCMRSVGVGAFEMVNEVRRQFREIEGIMEGKAKPDYARCVDISVRTALKGMALPGALALLSPLVVGFVFGWEALGAMLIGAIVTGLCLALMMANGGAAWDNAKKFIELGHFGGKKSPAHAAAVVGDTVGDPFKDTAGPALNPMIKVINMISVIFAKYIARLAIL